MTYRSHSGRAKKQILNVVEVGLRDMGADIVKQAISNASQSKGSSSHPQRQTGTLVRSITMDMIQEKGQTVVKVGVMKGTAESDKALVYAAPLEFGTDRHPPYPYLYPAAAEITSKARNYF